jgi:hypothetical protein
LSSFGSGCETAATRPTASYKIKNNFMFSPRFRMARAAKRSAIRVSGTDDLSPWHLLAKNAHALGSYRIVQVEIAFDVDAGSEQDARNKLDSLVQLLAKPRHYREYLLAVNKPEQKPRRGCMPEPTFYFEDRASSVALKCYCRYLKQKEGRFAGPCVRLEWTLTGKKSIERHLGGNKISNLLGADLNKFVEKNLRLESADHAALDRLIAGLSLGKKRPPKAATAQTKGISNKKRRPIPAGIREIGKFQRMLLNFAYREEERQTQCRPSLNDCSGRQDAIFWACRHSPAQMRFYLDRLQRKQQLRQNPSLFTRRQKAGFRKRGRPKQFTVRRVISNHRIDACFTPIQLIRVYNHISFTQVNSNNTIKNNKLIAHHRARQARQTACKVLHVSPGAAVSDSMSFRKAALRSDSGNRSMC